MRSHERMVVRYQVKCARKTVSVGAVLVAAAQNPQGFLPDELAGGRGNGTRARTSDALVP